MRLKLNQRQKGLLMEFKKRAYSFDWDDNILFMPTQIHLEKKVGSKWVPVSISTEEFRDVRNDIGDKYRYVDNSIIKSFQDFRNFGHPWGESHLTEKSPIFRIQSARSSL